jgi:hypothetical protein
MPFLTGRHRTLVAAISLVLLAVLGWLDYITGYEFGFFIFYFLPVSTAAWLLGRREGLLFAFLSAIAFFLSDRLGHHPYSNPFFIWWETAMRLASFVTTALTLSRIQQLLGSERALRGALAAAEAENARLRADAGAGGPASAATGEPVGPSRPTGEAGLR